MIEKEDKWIKPEEEKLLIGGVKRIRQREQ